MVVHSKDHDMLMLAYVFRLYHLQVAEIGAYLTATQLESCVTPLSATGAANILIAGGLEATALAGAAEYVWRAARYYALSGCVTLVHLAYPKDVGEALWHMLHDPVGDRAATLMMHEEPGEAIMAGEITDYFLGEAVIVPRAAPGFEGRWGALTHP